MNAEPQPPRQAAAIKTALTVTSMACRDGLLVETSRLVPEEAAIAFTYNRNAHAVMMATPADLEDFAVGFSLAEGVITDPGNIEALETIVRDIGIELRMWIRKDLADSYSERRRYLAGPTGCGLCGVESLEEAARRAPAVGDGIYLNSSDIGVAIEAMQAQQSANRRTRAMHAAGLWSPTSGLAAVREDVGRHNALDKLAGAAARQSLDPTKHAAVLTSRVSVEMVQKAATMGTSILIAISAPTALAIRTARHCGMTLVAVARGEDFEVFTHPHRICGPVMRNVA